MSKKIERKDILDDLISLIAASLATHSDSELEVLLKMLQDGQFSGLETLRASNNAIMVQVDPNASKNAINAALDEMSNWVEENWHSPTPKTPEGLVVPGLNPLTKRDLPN